MLVNLFQLLSARPCDSCIFLSFWAWHRCGSTPLYFFLLSATYFWSCTNWWLLKSRAYWDPSFSHTVFGEDILCNTWRRGVVFHVSVNSCRSPLGTEVLQSCCDVLRGDTVAVWRLCLESYSPPDDLWSVKMAQAMLSVHVWGKRATQSLQGLSQPLSTILCSYGTLMDNNGCICGPACIPGPWNSACSGEHVYKVAGFVPLKRLPPAPWTTDLVLQHAIYCHGLPWAVWGWMETPSSLLSSGGSFWACWGATFALQPMLPTV